MTISPGSSRVPSSLTASSVVSPAGNISQTARGFSASLLTTSASDVAAIAPSLASASRVVAVRENTTQECPAFIRRRDMLPPIFPSPITPIFMVFSPFDGALCGNYIQNRLLEGLGCGDRKRALRRCPKKIENHARRHITMLQPFEHLVNGR